MFASSGVWLLPMHSVFWAAFGVPILVSRAGRRKQPPAQGGIQAEREDAAPHSRALIFAHSLAFMTLYAGLWPALGGQSAGLFPGQPLAGALVIGLGAALCCWAVLSFGSWRFRAAVDAGHELATGGPFRFLRHPIYMALNLLALGTALWFPIPMLWVAFVLMVIGSDLRARAEESLLLRSFGEVYTTYCQRTARFVPGVY